MVVWSISDLNIFQVPVRKIVVNLNSFRKDPRPITRR